MIENAIKRIEDGQDKLLPSNKIIIWGAGVSGMRGYELLQSFKMENNIIAFVDNDQKKQGTDFLGIHVYSPEYLDLETEASIVICTQFHSEIYPYIRNNGERKLYYYESRIPAYGIIKPIDYLGLSTIYQNDSITIDSIDLLHCLRKYERGIIVPYEIAASFPVFYHYWDNNELSLIRWNKVTMVDAGAYTGDSVKLWLKSYRNIISKIYAFEPDEDNFMKLTGNIEVYGVSDISLLFNVGLSNKRRTLRFSCGHDASNINSDGDVLVPVVPLDEMIEHVDGKLCIKMDIEGSELYALEGAKETIKKYKPELAICVYHKYDDVITIPKYIKSICPEYNCVLRCGPHMECYASVERY